MTSINKFQQGSIAVCMTRLTTRIALLATVCFSQIVLIGCSSSQQHRTLSKETLGMDTVVVYKPIVSIKKKSMFSTQTDTLLIPSGKETISKTIAKVLTKKTDKMILFDSENSAQDLNAEPNQEINPVLVANLVSKLKSGDCKRTCSEVVEIVSANPSNKILVFSLWKGVVRSPARQFMSDLMSFGFP